MNAEIITIGTELLLGDIVNTNAAFLSQKLAELGIDVYRHSTVGDNPQRLSSIIKSALSISNIVITTGGLGPTVDDVTVATISKTLGRKLIFDKTTSQRIKNRFKRRHIKLPQNNLRQAYIPEGSIALKNNEGTAPGLFIKLATNKYLIALPGPPKELEPMFKKYAVRLLKKVSDNKYVIKSRFIKIIGLPESRVCEKIKDLLELKPPTTVGIYAKLGEVALKIMAKAKNESQTMKAIGSVEKVIRRRLGDYIFGVNNQTLEGVVGELLIKNKKTLSVAESCTGGLISNRITDVPGSSKYFKMGVVAYDNMIKAKFLLDVGARCSVPCQNRSPSKWHRAYVDWRIPIQALP
jgi:nicotinamide-nucleotide amidase